MANDRFTWVEIAFYPDLINHWLRFGTPEAWHDLDRRRSLVVFRPGAIFGYVRWTGNDYGTLDWRFSVLRAGPGDGLVTHDGIHPGAEILLTVRGKPAVKRALDQIDRLEARGIDPAGVAPDYYRHLHIRIKTRRPIRPYSVPHSHSKRDPS